jgi:hypothetical protein
MRYGFQSPPDERWGRVNCYESYWDWMEKNEGVMREFFEWFFEYIFLIGALFFGVLICCGCISSGDDNQRTFGWFLAFPVAIFLAVGLGRLAWLAWSGEWGVWGVGPEWQW